MESTTQSHRRPVPHRRRAVWLLAGLVALLLSVGGSSTALAKPSRAGAVGGTLTWALQTNPASLFDAYYFSAEGSTFFSLVQDHMLAPGTFGQPTTGEGAVVQSWKATSPDAVRVHDQEGHQVLRRVDAHREGRRVLDERPP